MSIDQLILRIASKSMTVRHALLEEFAKFAEEEKEKADFKKFVQEVYDGGKAKVPNPSSATRKRYKEVSFSTAMGTKEFRVKTWKEFKKWRASQDKKEEPKKEEPKKQPKKPDKETLSSLKKELSTMSRDFKDLVEEYQDRSFLPKNETAAFTEFVNMITDSISSSGRSEEACSLAADLQFFVKSVQSKPFAKDLFGKPSEYDDLQCD